MGQAANDDRVPPTPEEEEERRVAREEQGDAEVAGTRREEEEEEEEEEETCGFCIFMKGGGCKEAFEAWSQCVDSERHKDDSDFTETCRSATLALRECMLAHKDYYQPLLDEEEWEMEAQAPPNKDIEEDEH
mmetsp:Transcript_15610/g.44472  ORF Transcript_15610/g.44472 Transcript_15610/m.44472 type:complete len:132 (+) Transcript_15610:91-486(+)